MSVNYLEKTQILDFDDHNIQSLIAERNWQALDDYSKIGAAYTFVKDEIQFGYNRSDDITASEVLVDGYGQCNTKGNLLMALLRALGIQCRFHGFTIDQELQKGAIPAYVFWLAPKYIIHSWVEVLYDGKWINLEGFILDEVSLSSIQSKFSQKKENFCGYGIATTCLEKPKTEWTGTNTYIQKEGIHDDFGIYDSPDQFYAERGTNLTGVKRLAYQNLIRSGVTNLGSCFANYTSGEHYSYNGNVKTWWVTSYNQGFWLLTVPNAFREDIDDLGVSDTDLGHLCNHHFQRSEY